MIKTNWRIPNGEFSNVYIEMYPEPLFEPLENFRERKNRLRIQNITIIVTQDCQLRCSYCYQHAKNCYNAMDKKTAREIVDLLFKLDAEDNPYINKNSAEAIILDFIGGEPLLEIDLIDYLVRYFRKKAVELNHRWALNYMLSFSTNGIYFNNPNVQKFIKKNKPRLSMGITIDGNKELHDACRRFPDGSPSYDIVAKSIKNHTKLFYRTTTKLTLAPGNISYLYPAIRNLYDEFKMEGVFANCVFEEGWTKEHAKIFYNELKKLADWIINNDIEKEFFCTLFDEHIGTQIPEEDNMNFCGGTGAMISITADGRIQPCLRYTDFNLNYRQPELNIGTLKDGIYNIPEHKKTVDMLDKITRRSQSNDECFYCPIGQGCSWCSGHNYEVYGTPDKRTTFICDMHKARVLANRYYWQQIYQKYRVNCEFKFCCPEEWALEIISKDEFEMLRGLENGYYKNSDSPSS